MAAAKAADIEEREKSGGGGRAGVDAVCLAAAVGSAAVAHADELSNPRALGPIRSAAVWPIRATGFRSLDLARASLYSQVKLEDRRLTVAPGPAGQLRQFRDALVVAHARQVLRDRLILRESADTRRAERRSRNALARGPLSATISLTS